MNLENILNITHHMFKNPHPTHARTGRKRNLANNKVKPLKKPKQGKYHHSHNFYFQRLPGLLVLLHTGNSVNPITLAKTLLLC